MGREKTKFCYQIEYPEDIELLRNGFSLRAVRFLGCEKTGWLKLREPVIRDRVRRDNRGQQGRVRLRQDGGVPCGD